MKKTFLSLMAALIAIALSSKTARGQLLTEDFNYTDGTVLTTNGWIAASGGGTNSITVLTASALTYSGYLGSGIGNGVSLTTSGEDDYMTFAQVTSGTLYLSALVNLSAAQTTGDYFLVPYGTASTGGGYFGRIFAKSSGSGFVFGLSKSVAPPTYESTVRSFGTTYLVVVKYTFVGTNTSITTDDLVDLWVNPTIGSTETTATISAVGNGDKDNYATTGLNAVALRQGTVSSAPTVSVDGIRVATSWGGIPLPVEINSFIAFVRKNGIELAWNTATEIDNYGFDVERKSMVNGTLAGQGTLGSAQSAMNGWTKVGFVNGNGTSNVPHRYSFVDNSTSFGTYSYRLKQIDHDGKFEYSNTIDAMVAIAPNTMQLGQNYPNPFNPQTSIEFVVPTTGYTTLKVYNTLGEEVTTLVSGNIEAGVLNHISFNGDNFASGEYFYRLRSGSFVETKKMLMIK
ncbi:MAG: T9SS type A sorting domain-containing protein [Bacteroidota bacterium]